MKNVELTTWERIVLDMAVGAARGDIQTIQTGLKLKEKLGLSDEEKEEINFREIAPGNARWDDTTRLWPVEFDDQEWRALQQFVRTYQGWPMDQRSAELFEKVIT